MFSSTTSKLKPVRYAISTLVTGTVPSTGFVDSTVYMASDALGNMYAGGTDTGFQTYSQIYQITPTGTVNLIGKFPWPLYQITIKRLAVSSDGVVFFTSETGTANFTYFYSIPKYTGTTHQNPTQLFRLDSSIRPQALAVSSDGTKIYYWPTGEFFFSTFGWVNGTYYSSDPPNAAAVYIPGASQRQTIAVAPNKNIYAVWDATFAGGGTKGVVRVDPSNTKTTLTSVLPDRGNNDGPPGSAVDIDGQPFISYQGYLNKVDISGNVTQVTTTPPSTALPARSFQVNPLTGQVYVWASGGDGSGQAVTFTIYTPVY